jgi:hypothetical protein
MAKEVMMQLDDEDDNGALIDLGVASVETAGNIPGAGESLGRFGATGLSDD